MSPQPFYQIKEYATGFSMGHRLHQRPELAALVMQVIEVWSATDAVHHSMLADLIEVDVLTAVHMLQTVDSATVRKAMIDAAAERVLPQNDYLLYHAVLHRTRAAEKRRNDFAHHLWAVIDMPAEPPYTEKLILLDPKRFHRHLAERRDQTSTAIPSQEDWYDDAPVYSKDDLQESVEMARSAYRVMHLFATLVARRKMTGEAVDSIRRELLSDSLIQQKFDNLSQKRNQTAPP